MRSWLYGLRPTGESAFLTPMRKISFTLLLLASLAVISCSKSEKEDQRDEKSYVWDFDSADGWVYFHQDTASIDQWAIDNGNLLLTTRAFTRDRSKMHTSDSDFADGCYRWRTYVPPIGNGEQVSIGSWIYCDDHHELDFEVGSGKADVRKKYGAESDQLLACMTSQDHPYVSEYTPIAPGWHDFELRLDVMPDGCYQATWSIDGKECQKINLNYGPEYGFAINCSVENLLFIGDTISQSDYTARFDRVSFDGNKAKSQK